MGRGLAVVGVGIYSLGQTRADIKNSCVLRSDPESTLAGAVAANNVRCVDYWLLQRGIPASEEEEDPLLYVAAGKSDVRVLNLLLNSGHFDPNIPTAP